MANIKRQILYQLKKRVGLEKKSLLAILNSLELENVIKSTIQNQINNSEFSDNIQKIYNFLSSYSDHQLNQDFKNFFSTLSTNNIPFSFYIYVMYIYFVKQRTPHSRKEQITHNLSLLFYTENVEAIYNPQKFREHFKRAYLEEEGIDNPLEESLASKIKAEIPSNLKDELELAIALYILLCKKLCYCPEYILCNKTESLPKYWEVNSSNNQVICYTFSIIYYKLLKSFCIDVNLSGNYFSHMKVNLRIDSMMLEADATIFGRQNTSEYIVSDMANVKYGLPLTGFKLASFWYAEEEYIKYNKKRLEETIIRVSNLLYERTSATKIATILYERTLELRKRKSERKINLEEEIDFQMSTLNQLISFQIKDAECENKQFIAKLRNKLFSAYKACPINPVLLYKKEQGQVHLYNLYIITIENNFLYYLETEKGIIKYTLGSLKETIEIQNLNFKNQENSHLLYGPSENKQKIKKIQISSE